MATDRAGSDPVRGPLVLALFTVAPGCGGAAEGTKADHTTVWRWVQRYSPELEQRLRRYLKPTNKSWRVDETYVRGKGCWCYLYRAFDTAGAPIDFLLSGL